MDRHSKEFKALESEWYKKLKDEGFDDAEQSEVFLKQWHGSLFSRYYDKSRLEARAEYYREAEHFLNRHTFETQSDAIIWKLHSEGYGSRKIAKALKELGIRTNKDKVLSAIHRLQRLLLK